MNSKYKQRNGGNAKERRQQRRLVAFQKSDSQDTVVPSRGTVRLPLFFGWELVLSIQKISDLRQHIVGPFRTYRGFALTATGITVILIIGAVFFLHSSLRAATYTWVQTAWTGGNTANVAVHPTNQTGWTQYSAADATISTGSSVSLATTAQSITDTTDTDFTAGTQSSTSINGTGTSATEQLSISEGASPTFTQYANLGAYYEYDSVTNSVWVSGSSETLTKYNADGTTTTAIATLSLSSYDATGTAPIVFDPVSGVLWAIGKSPVNSDLNLIKINVTTATVISSTAIENDNSVVRDIRYDSVNDVLWIAYTWTSGSRIIKVNKSGTVLQTIALATTPTEMAVDTGTSSIWYVDSGNTVYKQPESGAAGTSLTLGGGYSNTRHIIYESATPAIWVTSEQFSFSGYSRILTSNNSITSKSDAGIPGGITYDSVHDVLWVPDILSAKVYKINRTSPAVITNYVPSNSSGYSHALYEPNSRSFWFNDNAGGTKRMTFVSYASSGNFTSRIIDTTANVAFGNATWNSLLPTNTSIAMKIRSSNSASMSGAPAWASCSTITSGQNPTAGGCVTYGHRYIQYNATLATTNTAISPSLQDITLTYTIYTNGTITSSVFDGQDATNVVAKMQWTRSGTGTIQFQLRTSPDGAAWTSWLGPTGAGDYYTDANGGESINTTQHDGSNDRYLQYKAFLISADGVTTPTLTGTTVTYVVNAAPEFEAAPTAVQNADGTVTITYSIRDSDTDTDNGSVGVLTPSFEYSTDNGAHWSSIASGLPASATTAKSVEKVNFTSYTTTWTAKTPLNGTYAAQAKIRITVSDQQAANATAQGTTAAFALDVKDPTLGGTPISVDASVSPAAISLSASDDSSLTMCVTLDNTQSNCVAYSASTTLTLATDPDTVYVIFVDSKGNTSSANAVTPQTPTNLVIRDISNPTTSEYQLFLTWAATSIAAPQFSQYRIYQSTNGTSFSLLGTISDRTVNYYLHKALTSNSDHWYKVAAATNTGNVSYLSSIIHGTANGQGGGTDLTAPTISSVVISSITTQSAVITWNTDELSNSTVGYSTTAATFTTETGSATMVDSSSGVGGHSVTLTNLTPNTTYYFRVKSTDPTGNEAIDTHGGDGYSFLTLAGPTISTVTTSEIHNDSAVITWQTNIPANSTVSYSTSASLAAPTTVTTADLVTSHSVTLTGLSLGTRYYYEVQSGVALDPNGGIYFSFVTTADLTAPVISSITVAPITDTQAVIQWITNERATSQVLYGTVSGLYPVVMPNDTNHNITHSVTLSSLLPATTYVFVVRSADASGNTATSTETSFTTKEKQTGQSDLDQLIAAAKNANTDTTAPILSSISISALADTTATITWSSNETANSFVQFGPTTADQAVFGNWVYDTGHSIVLHSLVPSTTYSYRVVSADLHGNTAFSDTATFTTQAAAQATLDAQYQDISQAAQALPGPVISGEPRVDLTPTTALISWTTDVAANSLVAFADDSGYTTTKSYTQTVGDADRFVQIHSVKIVTLLPDTQYHYQVRSKTAVSQLASTIDYTFHTPKKEFTIENYSVDSPSTDAAIFRWTTSEASTATVQLIPYRNNVRAVDELKTVVDTTSTLIHQISINELEPAVRYNVELISVNTAGLRTSKTIDTFSTSSVSLPPVISGIRVDSALSTGEKVKVQTIVSWNTNSPATSQVFYREGVGKADAELPEKTDLDTSYTKHHVVVITSLSPGSVYQLRVESKDSNGQTATAKPLTMLTPQQERTVFQVITNAVQQVFGWTQLINR